MPLISPGSVPSEVRSPFAPDISLRTTPEWHLARRAAQAPTADLVADIARQGIWSWIDAQLAPDSIPDPLWTSYEGWKLWWLRETYPTLMDHSGRREIQIGGALCQGLAHRPVLTSRVLWESMVTFWGDHLYVPWRSKASGHVIGFDRDVLRRHALGRYDQMLLAAVTSPALLVYLDNVENRATRPAENLGRELLEIYTVGRAYTEEDIAQSSYILSGLGVEPWSGTFRFTASDHGWNPVKVLGFSHPNSATSGGAAAPPDVVKAYIDYLARHPQTAARLARKLTRRFVSDNPSDELVQAVAKAYLDNDTAITPMLRVIFGHPEFWGSVGQKWARPREVIATARRACRQTYYVPQADLDQDAWAMGPTVWWYDTAGDLPRDWPMVDGYPDDAQSWMGPSTLLATWNAVAGVALHWDKGAPEPRWEHVLGVPLRANAFDVARRMTLQLTGYAWPEEHIATVASMLSRLGAAPAQPTDTLNADHLQWNLPEAVHLVLSSPYAFLR